MLTNASFRGELPIKDAVIKELKELQDEKDKEKAGIRANELIRILLINLECKDVSDEWKKIDQWYS